jgi:protein-disulfide isomerase
LPPKAGEAPALQFRSAEYGRGITIRQREASVSLITGNDAAAHQDCRLLFMATKKKRSYLAFAIIAAVLVAAMAAGIFLFQAHRKRPGLQVASTMKPGAQPPHVRGDPNAPVTLEEFGDFECMPCFILWPALRNLEKDYGEQLAVIFRQNPMPQHSKALDGARAAEAAGLQGKFWEMHDLLYLQRGKWTRAADPRSEFGEFARRLELDVERFNKDVGGDEVAKRVGADRERAGALGLDRTPVIFVNGRRAELQSDVEKGLRNDIEAALGARP